MAKKSARKPGGAASIAVIEDADDDVRNELDESPAESEPAAKKPGRAIKAKTEQPSNGHFGVGEIKKAAAFANSIGGLDKAIAVLQILKVAKEVQ